jgi:hypothetical protein
VVTGFGRLWIALHMNSESDCRSCAICDVGAHRSREAEAARRHRRHSPLRGPGTGSSVSSRTPRLAVTTAGGRRCTSTHLLLAFRSIRYRHRHSTIHSPVSKRAQLIASLVRFRTCRLTQAFDDSVVAIERSMGVLEGGNEMLTERGGEGRCMYLSL